MSKNNLKVSDFDFKIFGSDTEDENEQLKCDFRLIIKGILLFLLCIAGLCTIILVPLHGEISEKHNYIVKNLTDIYGHEVVLEDYPVALNGIEIKTVGSGGSRKDIRCLAYTVKDNGSFTSKDIEISNLIIFESNEIPPCIISSTKDTTFLFKAYKAIDKTYLVVPEGTIANNYIFSLTK